MLLAVAALLLSTAQAVTFNCKDIVADGIEFKLDALGGRRSVSWEQDQPPSVSNTTFTLDICQALGKEAGLPDAEQCPSGTRVCAVERDTNAVENTTTVRRVIPIAGEFTSSAGLSLDPKITRLKHSPLNPDADREGLIVELNGGKYPLSTGGRRQKAIVTFECDRTRTGNEEYVLDGGESGSKRRQEGGEPDADDTRSLRFQSYKEEDDTDVLRLEWRTKYACETVDDDDDDDDGAATGSKGWGFFGWLFIILFLGAAAYLIFGSWLNYTRYGARGWDLVPHGDTIREMPYIVKDWGKSVIDTVQGRGYRGGYSAV